MTATDTVVLSGTWGPLTFRNPVHVLRAHTPGEVLPVLERVDAYVDEGYYAAGHVSYDDGGPAWRVPCAWFGIYADVDTSAPARSDLGAPELLGEPPGGPLVGPLLECGGREAFLAGVERVRALIREGDVYQINYTTVFEGPLHAAPDALHAHILERHPVPWAARIAYGEGNGQGEGSGQGDRSTHILSWSPELFFEINPGRRRIWTRPMKGTHARGLTLEEDAAYAEALRTDPKSRAENLMIVDLLRNDLSRVCTPGSVRVPALLEVETYGSVLQMTSTVEGDLCAGMSLADVFGALFPCGSVTGAPKRRAMQRIAEIEPEPRGVYCGAIGYAAPDGAARFNVAIRTALVRDGRMRLGAGAGIVWDSDAAAEYEETCLKTRFLTAPRPTFRLLETMRAEGGRVRNLDAHMARLGASARYFGWDVGLEGIRTAVECVAMEAAAVRIRLTVGQQGDVEFQLGAVPTGSTRLKVGLSGIRVDTQNVFLRHKTTYRPEYDQSRRLAGERGWFDALLVNEKGYVTEGSITNLFIRQGDVWTTPPEACGLLGGTARAAFMATRLAEDGRPVREAPITPADVESADDIVLTNAVIGSAPAEFVH